MNVSQQGSTMDSLAATLRLSRKELQRLSVQQYSFLQKLVMNEPDEEFMQVVQQYSSDELQAIASGMGLNIGHAVPVDLIDRLLRRVRFTLHGTTRRNLIGALERDRTGVVDLRLFFRLWSFWHAGQKARQATKTAHISRLLRGANEYPEVEQIVRDMQVMARELLLECEREDGMNVMSLPDDKFLAVLDRRGVRLSHTQLPYLLLLLESAGFRIRSNVRYHDVFVDLAGPGTSNAGPGVSNETRSQLEPRVPEPMGAQLVEEVQRRWSFARSLLPLRVVKDDLVDAFKHIGFSLSPAQANELWHSLSDAVSMRRSSRTETFLDKKDLDRLFTLRTESESAPIDMLARRKNASRASSQHQQNTSTNIFNFASQPPPARPVSAPRPQTGRMRSSHDPTDLFDRAAAPPNVLLRARRHLHQASPTELRSLQHIFNEYGGIHGIASATAVCEAFRMIGLFLTSAGADDMLHWVQEHRTHEKFSPVTFHELISTSAKSENILALLEQPMEAQTPAQTRPTTSHSYGRGDEHSNGIRRTAPKYRQDTSQAMNALLTRPAEEQCTPQLQVPHEPAHQRHQQQIFPAIENSSRTHALQHLQLERPTLAMHMRAAQRGETKLDRHALTDVLLHPRLQMTAYLSEADIRQLVDDIIAFTDSQSGFPEARVDFSNMMTYISQCLNQNEADDGHEEAVSDTYFRRAICQKLFDSAIIQGDANELLGMHPRLLQRLVDLRSRGARGVERELQGAELLTVASLTECLYGVDISLTREEATWLWSQATEFDSQEPGRQQQPLSTHEQSQAVTLSSVITVLLTILSNQHHSL